MTDWKDLQPCRANGLNEAPSGCSSHAVASLAQLLGLDDFVQLAPSSHGNMLATTILQPSDTGTQAALIDNRHQHLGAETYSEDDEIFSRVWNESLPDGLSEASIPSAPSALQIPPDFISPPAPVSLNKPGTTHRAPSLHQSLGETPQAWSTNGTISSPSVMTASKATLEEKLGRVLEVMVEEGFPDFEDMAQAYYTGTVAKHSDLGVRQGVSRKRNLPRLIEAIHHASGAWRFDEAKPWQDAVVRSAEAVYLSELNGVSQTGPAASSHCHGVCDVLSAMDTMDGRDRVPEQAPELWSLMSILALHTASSEVKKKKVLALVQHVLTHGRLLV